MVSSKPHANGMLSSPPSFFDSPLLIHAFFCNMLAFSFLALLVYVDDVLLVGTHETHILRAKRFLHSTFTIKDLGYAKYFLGIEIARNPHGTYLN